MDNFETKTKRLWLRWTIALVVIAGLTIAGFHLFSNLDLSVLHGN
jgi:hypothetical protein